MGHPAPAEIVREIFERFRTLDEPFDLLDPVITWEVPTVDQPEQTFRGHSGVADFFRGWIGTWDHYEVELDEIVETPDGRVLAYFTERAKGKGSGVPVEMRVVGLWTIRDGKVVAYRGFVDRDEARRAAGLA